MTTELEARLWDLHKQATTEKSHFYVAKCCADAIDALAKYREALDGEVRKRVGVERQLDEARAECLEQARLNGMGGERELRLMAQLDEARAELTSAHGLGAAFMAERDEARAAGSAATTTC